MSLSKFLAGEGTSAAEVAREMKSPVTRTLQQFNSSYPFLSSRLRLTESPGVINSKSTSETTSTSMKAEIKQYIGEVRMPTHDHDALVFWHKRHASYPLLAPVAEDLLAAPASQAYVERIFSLCGWFTAGRKNRLARHLEMRVFLKLNNEVLS